MTSRAPRQMGIGPKVFADFRQAGYEIQRAVTGRGYMASTPSLTIFRRSASVQWLGT